MTTKPPRTKEEQFWLDIRRAFLELVNVIEVGKLSAHIDVPTSQVRKHLRAYRQQMQASPIVGVVADEVLTIAVECDKL